jgi:hypothetical protein
MNPPATTTRPAAGSATPNDACAEKGRPGETYAEYLARLERARRGRLRSLWQMSVEQRIAAMRRGELTLEQLAAWSARHPDQVPRLNDEFEWIAIKTPGVCE